MKNTQSSNPTQPDDCPDWPEEFASQYADAGYWLPLTFDDLLVQSAIRFKERIAFHDISEQITFSDFEYRVACLATGFLGHGLLAGDNAVVQLTNRIAFAEVFFALMRIGVRPVLSLPAHREIEIHKFCEMSRAAAYITEDDQSGFDYRVLARSLTSLRQKPRLVIIVGVAQEFLDLKTIYLKPEKVKFAPKPSDVACFQLSGGTTGTPKLIPRRHREYVYNVRASADLCGFDESTVYLTSLPVAHNFPLCCPGVVGTLYVGGKTVFSPNANPESIFPLIAEQRVTATALVPPLALVWAEAIAELGYESLTSLQLLQVGGAKLTIEAAKRVRRSFKCRLQQVFGMAEGLICYTRLDDSEDHVIGTQGRPLSSADEVKVVDASGECVPDGEVGSLLVRGPYTIRGYYRAAEHNATAFTDDGFYRTGDRVQRTHDGYLIVEGRDKEQINRGGEKVAPEEIEDVLLRHPSVIDAAAVAVPDSMLGERICVFVISRDPLLGASELKRFARESGIATFKVPDRIQFVDGFPETGVGKTSRKALRLALRTAYPTGAASKP